MELDRGEPTEQSPSQNNMKKSICEKMLDKKEELFDDRHPWTIYLLVDLKVVFIITFAYITIVNLMSSTANSEAFTDRKSMMLFNVSSKYMNVNVDSINDAVLWNCRRLSSTSNYYMFLYWMVIVSLVVVMGGFFVIKLIALITVSSNLGCKMCCSCQCSTFKHGLTKLWHIAIYEKMIDQMEKCDEIENDECDNTEPKCCWLSFSTNDQDTHL